MPYEVFIKLQFQEPCLGNERFDDPEPNKMRKTSSGAVIFNEAWWRTILIKAAEVIGRHQNKVKQITWTPEVDGTIKMFPRYYYTGKHGNRERKVKMHEAFLSGDVIGVIAVIPDDIPMEDFRNILSKAGAYFGISPFGWNRGYGKFSVVQVGILNGQSSSKTGCEGEHAVHQPGDENHT